jgi:hypothetical protein
MEKEAKKADKVTSEKIMSDKVKTAILRGIMKLPDGNKLKCDIAIREMGFRNCQFDVIGYNKIENTVYIFECKLGTNITSIGQAFGQILGYKSVLEERGYEFLNGFYQKYHEDVVKSKGWLKIKLEDWFRILSTKKIGFRFFVVLKSQSKELFREIMSIKRSIKPDVGVLSITEDGICTPHLVWKKEIDDTLINSGRIEIELIKKYKREEFFDALERKLRLELPEKCCEFKTNSSKNTSYKYFGIYPGTHYEVGMKYRNMVEIGFHIETTKEKTSKLFALMNSNKPQLKRLGKNIKIEKWGAGWTKDKGVSWARVYEKIPKEILDENFLTKASERIKEFVGLIQPILENA